METHITDFPMDRAWIEIDRAALRHNVAELEKLLPHKCRLMPAVKANAYGHGSVLIAKELNRIGIRSFCTATVKEGIELRRNGVKGEILILGYTHPQYFPHLKRYDLTQSVIDYSYAQILNSYGKKLKVHIKIDTGMHRLGERSENTEQILKIFRLENLIINGIYTHLCVSDSHADKDIQYTLTQASAFDDVIFQIQNHGFLCPKTHLQASYGVLNFPNLSGNYARIGIALYGVLSTRENDCPVDLRPVLSLKARVISVKNLLKGESVGYGLQYTAKENTKIAVLSIGYADGYPRSLSCGIGKVLVNGIEAPIVGRICMDQMTVDVTKISDITTGDIATIIGKSGASEITVYDIAEQAGTITNEILSRLGPRVERLVINGGKKNTQ